MKIICVGRNYKEHAKELGNKIPVEPVIFMKPQTALLDSNKPLYYPEFTNELHYECELVIKIAKNGKHIRANDAFNFFNEITVGIDFTARDKQNELKEKGLPWEKAKAFDGSACIGKWVRITNKEMLHNLEFSLMINQEQKQLGYTKDMIFTIPHIIADVSQYFSLNIGDLIFTGTPEGVGECFPNDQLEGYLGKQKLLNCLIK